MAKEKDVNNILTPDEEAYEELLNESFENLSQIDTELESEEKITTQIDTELESEEEITTQIDTEKSFEDISSSSEKEKNPFKRIAAWYKRLPKGKKIAATAGAAVIVLLLILIIFVAAVVISKLGKIGTHIDKPLSVDETIYDEQEFTEIDGQVGAAGFQEALYEWATAGGEDTIMSSKNVLNVLLIGADSRLGTNTGNTDVMMLISLNKKTREIKMTSLFRDCYLYIDNGEYGSYHKLNSAYSKGGIDCLINTIQNNFKIKIDNYVMVNFESFRAVIDAMGGVTVKVQEYEANYIEGRYKIKMPVGESVTLNGEQALIFSRVRGCDADADVSRTRRQRQVINAIMNEFQRASLTNINKYIDTVLPYIYTGFSEGEILSLGLKALAGGWVNYPRSELQIPTSEARASGYAGSMWIWVVDYQLAAHTLQTEIYGNSNITLTDGRRTIIDIYNGVSGTGSSSSSSGSTPVETPSTTVPVSGAETTAPVSVNISETVISSENTSETEALSEPLTGEEVTEPVSEGEGSGETEPPVTEPVATAPSVTEATP